MNPGKVRTQGSRNEFSVLKMRLVKKDLLVVGTNYMGKLTNLSTEKSIFLGLQIADGVFPPGNTLCLCFV